MPPEAVIDKCMPGGLHHADGKPVDARLVPVDRLDEIPPVGYLVRALPEGVDPTDPAALAEHPDAVAAAQVAAFAVAPVPAGALATEPPATASVRDEDREAAAEAAAERIAARLEAERAARAEVVAGVVADAKDQTVAEVAALVATETDVALLRALKRRDGRVGVADAVDARLAALAVLAEDAARAEASTPTPAPVSAPVARSARKRG